MAHYVDELMDTLKHAGNFRVSVPETTPGEKFRVPLDRIRTSAQVLRERNAIARETHDHVVIVVWPLFGYLDPLSLLRLARRNTVYMIIHDPFPLRRSYGQSRLARRLFKEAVRRRDIKVLYHTVHAQRIGTQLTGVEGAVVPHPVTSEHLADAPHRKHDKPVVRVLGQFKDTRSLNALTSIADSMAGFACLEIHGRGWPKVPGWFVHNRFVPEREFEYLIESSDCVVIPYDTFFQSGVAVRCLEAGVPVVAPYHEHVAQLYGSDWAGAVPEGAPDWGPALRRALAADCMGIRERRQVVTQAVQRAWGEILLSEN